MSIGLWLVGTATLGSCSVLVQEVLLEEGLNGRKFPGVNKELGAEERITSNGYKPKNLERAML